jgi:four helix bundle protein
MSRYARSYGDLEVYEKALELQQLLFELSKAFPKEEMYSLTDQLRRSSRSIGANIAEAWQKRCYKAHFVSKMTDSDAELSETCHWLITALKCNYLSRTTYDGLLSQCREIGRLLGAIIKNASSWCDRTECS